MNHRSTLSYFYGSFAFVTVAVTACYYIAGYEGAFQALILALLETSMSMDNAVVNSTILKKMSPFVRRLFLTVGMIIAVFFMRLLFPVIIVWMSKTLTFTQAIFLPFDNPTLYQQTLTSAAPSIAGFGGMFLLLVFFSFFLDEEKDQHWLPIIEPLLKRAAALKVLMTLVVLGLVTWLLPSELKAAFCQAGILGLTTYMAVEKVGDLVQELAPEDQAPSGFDVSLREFFTPSKFRGMAKLLKGEFALLLYLEMIDASFSFDGVVGAFAVSNNALVIALGLGTGAMFVRSLTLLLVDKDTIGTFRYLEHGAFWSIGFLAVSMFVGLVVEVPEYVSGLAAAVIITVAVIHSAYANRRELALATE